MAQQTRWSCRRSRIGFLPRSLRPVVNSRRSPLLSRGAPSPASSRDRSSKRSRFARAPSHAPAAPDPPTPASRRPHSVIFGSTLARRGDRARTMEQLAASSEATSADLAEYYLSDEFRTQYMKVSLCGSLGARAGAAAGVVASSAAQFARFDGAGPRPAALAPRIPPRSALQGPPGRPPAADRRRPRARCLSGRPARSVATASCWVRLNVYTFQFHPVPLTTTKTPRTRPPNRSSPAPSALSTTGPSARSRTRRKRRAGATRARTTTPASRAPR